MDRLKHEYLTTAEAADYLRLGERKLYELVAEARIPCTKATGKWLFPKALLDQWLAAGLSQPDGLRVPLSPPIVGGSHDPLLEWALRESNSGLALLSEGSQSGLRRLRTQEAMIAGIHLHNLEGEDENANIVAIANDSTLVDAVLISWAKREQGIVVAHGNPLGIRTIQDVATKCARIAERQTGAGAQALLMRLAKLSGVEFESLTRSISARTGDDLALAVREGRADCGIATRAVAVTRGLDFIPLIWERFDLAMHRRDYFEAGPQSLFELTRTSVFYERAAALGGYDTTEAGSVLFNR